MRPTPYVASLRVYEPLESFPQSDQERWREISIDSYTGREEGKRSLERMILSQSSVTKVDGAHVIDHDGKRFISPWSTARRCWAAIEDFKSSLPSSVIPMFFPDGLTDTLSEELDEFSGTVPHIISETWIIPPRWFSLFTPDERLRGSNDDGPFTIMRTEIENAKNRCISTHKIVRNAFGPGPVEEDILDLLNWLNVFHPKSIVECDYGGLAMYLEKSLLSEGDEGLEADHSIEDVSRSLQGLSNGDGALAGHGYEALVSRWRKVASFEQAM